MIRWGKKFSVCLLIEVVVWKMVMIKFINKLGMMMVYIMISIS